MPFDGAWPDGEVGQKKDRQHSKPFSKASAIQRIACCGAMLHCKSVVHSKPIMHSDAVLT